jgi:hypothetical protein
LGALAPRSGGPLPPRCIENAVSGENRTLFPVGESGSLSGRNVLSDSPPATPVEEPQNEQQQNGSDRGGDNGSNNAGAEVNAQLRQ